MDDDFWHKPKRPPAEIVAEHMARLTFTPADEPPAAPQPVLALYMPDDERLAAHDREQRLDGPIDDSPERLHRLGISMPRARPAYEAGDDREAQPD